MSDIPEFSSKGGPFTIVPITPAMRDAFHIDVLMLLEYGATVQQEDGEAVVSALYWQLHVVKNFPVQESDKRMILRWFGRDRERATALWVTRSLCDIPDQIKWCLARAFGDEP